MKPWMAMIAAGDIAILFGLVALINPDATGSTTITLVSWGLLVVAALQGWAAMTPDSTGARIRAGAIAAASALLGLSMLLGPFGSGVVLRWLVGLLLISSGGAKAYAALEMSGSDNRPLVFGTAAVSAVMGAVVLFGLNLNFGTLLGIELLASGLGLVLLGMDRRRTGSLPV